MLLTVGDVVEARLYSHSEGQYAINTLHYKVTAEAGGGSTDSIFAGDLSELFPAALKDCMSVEAAYVGLSVQIIRPTRRPKIVNLVGAGDGTFAGDILPRQVAGIIRKKTNTGNRHGLGRMFVPFPSEDCNSLTGFPSVAYTDKMEILATKVLTTVVSADGANTSTLVPVLYDRVLHNTIELSGGEIATVWGTCKRRSDVRGADRLPF